MIDVQEKIFYIYAFLTNSAFNQVFTIVSKINCLVQMMSFHIGDKFDDITNNNSYSRSHINEDLCGHIKNITMDDSESDMKKIVEQVKNIQE